MPSSTCRRTMRRSAASSTSPVFVNGVTSAVPAPVHCVRMLDLYYFAAGPHPRRELTLMLALGYSRPRARMAAGANLYHWRWRPHPQGELTLMLGLGVPWSRPRMAAGADL